MAKPGCVETIVRCVVEHLLQIREYLSKGASGAKVFLVYCRSGKHRSCILTYLSSSVCQWYFADQVNIQAKHLSKDSIWLEESCYGQVMNHRSFRRMPQQNLPFCKFCEGENVNEHHDIWLTRQRIINHVIHLVCLRVGFPEWMAPNAPFMLAGQ